MNGWDFMSQHPIVTVVLALIVAADVPGENIRLQRRLQPTSGDTCVPLSCASRLLLRAGLWQLGQRYRP